MAVKVSHEDFVVAWAASMTIEEVVKNTSMTKAAVNGRAAMLRKKGVRLPRLSFPSTLDDLRIAQLNSLIKKYDVRKKGN